MKEVGEGRGGWPVHRLRMKTALFSGLFHPGPQSAGAAQDATGTEETSRAGLGAPPYPKGAWWGYLCSAGPFFLLDVGVAWLDMPVPDPQLGSQPGMRMGRRLGTGWQGVGRAVTWTSCQSESCTTAAPVGLPSGSLLPVSYPAGKDTRVWGGAGRHGSWVPSLCP